MSSLQEPTREKNAVALSCQSCKTRKIKCDKGSPCSACAEHGRNCVPILRARLPRGRTKDRTNANGELKARLARLESLVSSLKNASGDQQAPPNGHDEHAHQVSSRLDSLTIDSTSPASQVTSNGQIGQPNWQWIADSHRWLGSTLWTQLGDQINGIHAVLEAEETEDDQLPGHNTVNGSPPEQDWITVDHSPSYQLHGSDSEPPLLSDHSKQAMIQLWVQRIDPVMKLIHEPSFTSYLRGASEYLDYVPGHPNVEALRAAVLYCCACSVTESESRSMFYLDRPDLIGIWRRYTEQCFAKADYIVSRDITMLQAMIYYLTALRIYDASSRSWTFLALTIRLATGMHLHRSCTYFNLPFFQAQMQGQVWYHLLALDHLMAMDRGSDPIMAANSYNTAPPMHVDDKDFYFDGPRPQRDSIGFTDKTYNSIRWCASLLIRQLNFVPAGDYDKPPTPMQGTWHIRLDAIRVFERDMEKYTSYLDLSIPLHLVCKRLSKTMVTMGLLFAFRPLQRHPGLPPPPKDEVNMLQVATEAIEASENLHNNGRSIYDWNTVRYNAWHALAVLLSELCQAQPQFDQQLLERAWTAGKSSFDRMADQIAEGSHGPLWTPMKKLMKTAQARMSKLFPTSTAASSPSMIGMQHAQMDHTCYLKDVGAYGSGDAFAAAPGVTESWDANFHPMQDSWLDWQGFTDDVVFGRNDHLDPMFLDPQAQGFMGWG